MEAWQRRIEADQNAYPLPQYGIGGQRQKYANVMEATSGPMMRKFWLRPNQVIDGAPRLSVAI